jgi:hypothetical protein
VARRREIVEVLLQTTTNDGYAAAVERLGLYLAGVRAARAQAQLHEVLDAASL